MAFSTAFWALFFVLYYIPIIFSSLIWIKLVYFCVIFQIISIYYFAFAFPDNKKPPVWSLILFGVLNTVILHQLIFTENFVAGVTVGPYGIETKLGPFYNLVVPVWAAFLNVSFFVLIKKFRKARGLVRVQSLYVLLGIGIYMGATILTDAIIPIFFGHTSLFYVSALSSLTFVTLTAYAIIKHRLMDIRLVLTRTVTYSILISVIGVLYVAITFAAGSLFLATAGSELNQLFIHIILTIIIALSFSNLKQAIESITDRFFFRGGYPFIVG